MGQHPARLAFLVGDQVFIADLEHAPGQLFAPQGHQPVEPHIIFGDLGQVIAVVVVA